MSSLSIRCNRSLTEQTAAEVCELLQNNAAKTFYQSQAAFSSKSAAVRKTASRFAVAPNIVKAASYYWQQ